MESKLFLLGCLIITLVPVLSQKSKCKAGPFGPNCDQVCGYCKEGLACLSNGSCSGNKSESERCHVGYTGYNCREAVCDGGCGSGKCIGPGICDCGEDINLVRPNCEDIRLRGLIGSAAAFATISTAITLCHLGSKWYKRRKEGASI